MLETRVTMGNISLFLLSLIERLIFAMFKDSYPFANVYAANIHIFVHQVRLLPAATFVFLPNLFG